MTIPVIDVDTHFNETPQTWDEAALPSSDRLRIQADQHGRQWLMLGHRNLLRLRVTVPGEVDLARDLVEADPLGYENLLARRRVEADSLQPHPSESNADERVRVLDAMKVETALMFPSYGLFWPSVVTDEKIGNELHRAWNTWIAAMVSSASARLVPIAQFTLSDVRSAVAEIYRCSALGHRGLFLRAVPYRGVPWGDPENEAVWSALEETNMALLLHAAPIGSTTFDPAWEKGLVPTHVGQPLSGFLTRSAPVEAVLANLIFDGVLARHPGLRIGAIEFGASWVPSFLKRIDYAFDFLSPRNRYMRQRLDLRPSEYFRRQVKVSTFWSEPLDWLFTAAGSDLFMFSSDFPHPEGNIRAPELARRVLSHASPDTLEAYFSGNAQTLLGITPFSRI